MTMNYSYQNLPPSPQSQISAGQNPHSTITAAVRRSVGLPPLTQQTHPGPRQTQPARPTQKPMLPVQLGIGHNAPGMTIKNATRQSVGLPPIPQQVQTKIALSQVIKSALGPAVAELQREIARLQLARPGPQKIPNQIWPAD